MPISSGTGVLEQVGLISDSNTDAVDLEPIVEQVLDAMHQLYIKWKGHSFLLVDVPPMHRSPGGTSRSAFACHTDALIHTCPNITGIDLGFDDERYTSWNKELLSQARYFAESTAHASVYVASSYNIIADFLDRPEAYGLQDSIEEFHHDSDSSENDTEAEEKVPEAMWEDNIHLSKVAHKAFAHRLWEALRE